MRPLTRILAATALCLAALPALANTQPRRPSTAALQQEHAAMCRANCLSTLQGGLGRSAVDPAQACAVRCAAAASFASQQDRRGTAEATGRGRVASLAPMPVAMGVPAPVTGRASHAVLYAGRAPSGAFGLAVGSGDRLGAHRDAERACATGGQGCRVVAEFNAACGAAAQGIKRSQWALFITSDPASYVVTSISGGSGATQAQAEGGALAECRSRDPGATCRIVASACGSRG
jgi:hypothetical protein